MALLGATTFYKSYDLNALKLLIFYLPMLLHSYTSVQALDCFSTHLACTKPNGKPWAYSTSLMELNISSSIPVVVKNSTAINVDNFSVEIIYLNRTDCHVLASRLHIIFEYLLSKKMSNIPITTYMP